MLDFAEVVPVDEELCDQFMLLEAANILKQNRKQKKKIQRRIAFILCVIKLYIQYII